MSFRRVARPTRDRLLNALQHLPEGTKPFDPSQDPDQPDNLRHSPLVELSFTEDPNNGLDHQLRLAVD